MKKTLTALALLALLPAGAALAAPAAPGDDTRPATAQAQADAPARLADARERHHTHSGVTDGRVARKGHDHAGKDGARRNDADASAARRHRHDGKALPHHPRNHARGADTGAPVASPAPMVAPPANGLFGTGAAPRATVN